MRPTKCTKLRSIAILFLLVAVISPTSSRTASPHRGHRLRHRFKRQYQHGPSESNGRHQTHIIPRDIVLGQKDSGAQGTGGRWSDWSPSSHCSRTCGGGVSSETRTCLDLRPDGASLCVGPSKKYFSCNIQDCPEGSMEFRAEQCSRFNGVPFDGRYYDWIPYTKGANKCELNCIPKGENAYYRHARRVIDGTKCDPDTLDVCVEGICLPVGCDLMLGSDAKEDKCRECGGDGSSCRTVEGLFDLANLQIGYNDILLVPTGATNIVIQERQPTNNYLAIRNSTGHYYLNGNWKIDFPRDLRFAGTVFNYERPHAFAAPESIRAVGPTTEPIFIVLLYQEANAGVTYEYSIPLGVSPTQPDTYSWVYGNYGTCSQSCAGGYETRNVSCAKTSSFEIVDEYLCDPLLQPPSNRSCNTQPCPASWHAEEWDACSVSCGSGVQFRGVYCHQATLGGSLSVVNSSECEQRGLTRPERLRPCSDEVPCPVWQASPWSACDKLCGTGQRTRSVTCQRNTTGNATSNLEVFHNIACDSTKMPASSEECDGGPCEGLDWILSDWSGCDSCGLRVESRRGHCSSQAGKLFPIELCDAERLPELVRNCTDSSECQVVWHATQWSECSSKCGPGVQTRDVFCGTAQNDTIQRVPDEDCILDKRYDDQQNCTGNDCEGIWFAGPWNRCTAPCGGGHQTRKVFCLVDNQVVSGGNCTAGEKPLYKEQCNTHPCDDDEILMVGGCKDSKHGCCPDGITPAGPNYVGCPTVISTEACEDSEFGCCSDGTTPALGPFKKGCPKVVQCKETKFQCCPDGVTPAKGLNNTGCPEPDSCAATLYGCCPDGATAAEGGNFAGCDFETTNECLTAEYGCCPDGLTAAEGSGYGGCEDDVLPDFRGFEIIEESGSGVECNDTAYGCCQDDLTPAEGPDYQGCPSVNTTQVTSLEIPFIMDNFTATCNETLFGCCLDNITEALGPDFEGCEDNVTAAVRWICLNSTYGCCLNNITAALGPDYEGCPEGRDLESVDVDCENTTYGCCLNGTSAALGWNNEGCDLEVLEEVVNCTNTTFGCCLNSTLAALGPDNEGCELEVVDCANTTFGCCLNGTSAALGPDNEGCIDEPQVELGCTNTTFGCCPDGNTTASGPDAEGCPEVTEPCHNSTYGCCLDGVTEAQGPDGDGCPSCTDMPFGCCYDGVTPARGERYQGCSCETFPYGCCPDGETFARGPNQEGCGCQAAPYGCCQDGISTAQGHGYEGCGCETYQHGCCPDGRTPAVGAQFQGCGCETWYYGCCPDERTAARGLSQEGCDCHSAHYGCCSDGVTAAEGPSNEGCPVQKQMKAGDVCGLPKERGECRNFTVKWFFDMDYGGCSRFWYGGCDGNDNRFDSQEECQQVCVAPEGMDACLLPRVVGPCDSAIPSWFYDNRLGHCQQFNYSGCLGNNNRFQSKEDCEGTCQKSQDQDPCLQPVMEGPCRGDFPRWHFDVSAGVCKTFVFGGCKGNNNNFENEKDCLQKCGHRSEKDVCLLARAEGPCHDYQIKWYYDQQVQRCGQFYYGGCEGNGNRFENENDCMSLCSAVTAPPPDPTDICALPRDMGNCNTFEERWFHDPGTGLCRSFIYSGCDGNKNNFASIHECELHCPPKDHHVDASKDKERHRPTEDFLLEYCHLERDAGPCYDSLERWFYDKVDGVCKNFQYGGCQGNGNRFTSRKDCEDRCFESQDVCTLSKVTGPCSGSFRQWFFDREQNTCNEFLYGGCEGNANRFDSPEECESRCVPQTTTTTTTTQAPPEKAEESDVCQLASNPGPCLSHIPSWHFDPSRGNCQPFIYGGCEGNANRFESEEECDRSCGQYRGRDICNEPQDRGPCVGSIQKWYYDVRERTCRLFLYGGCDGNGNRFSTFEECERTCPHHIPEPENVTDVCRLSGDPGPCISYEYKWFFDYNSGNCVPFTYGGCGGNGNRFATHEDCMSACGLRKRTCPEPSECYTLQCPHGIEQFHDVNSCPNCRCSDPCRENNCPSETLCVVEQHLTEDGEPRIQAVCRHESKVGECPYVDDSTNATCTQECQTDADCHGHRKCCFNGCGYSCFDINVIPQDRPHATEPPTDSHPPRGDPQPSVAVVPPRIVASEPEIVTSSGSVVTLRCTTHGNPRPSVEWYGPTRESLRSRMTEENGARFKQLVDGSLQIDTVTLSDAGNYLCVASSPAGTAERSTRLVVQDPVPTPAQIEVGVHVVVAALEKPCMLHCKAVGWPRPSVTWWRETRMLPRISEKYEQFHNYSLRIRTMTTHDLGPYECRAYNGIGQVAIWEVTVFVDGPTTLDPADAKLKYFGPDAESKKNNEINEVNDHPQEVPTMNNDNRDRSREWTEREHGDDSNSSPTNISNVFPTELSVVSPSNDNDKHVSSVADPVVPFVSQEVTANIVLNKTTFVPDSEIHIHCLTNNSQRTLWYKDGNLLKSDDRILVLANGTLFIKTALPIDSGRYDCEASNLYDRALSSTNIVVQGVNIPEDCTDSPFFANCKLIVKAKYCVNKYYRRFCCRSCALDGQISPANGDISNNLV